MQLAWAVMSDLNAALQDYWRWLAELILLEMKGKRNSDQDRVQSWPLQ